MTVVATCIREWEVRVKGPCTHFTSVMLHYVIFDTYIAINPSATYVGICTCLAGRLGHFNVCSYLFREKEVIKSISIAICLKME